MAYLDHYLKARNERLTRQVKKPRQIIKGQRRDHVINQAMDMLKDWRLSPFENQGSVHAGLRSALCMDGHAWLKADKEAGSLVAECLRLMGAEYPTWEQGQPEYTIPFENCAHCQRPMPAEEQEGLRKGRFCSTECAKAAWNISSQSASWRNSNVTWAAYRLILKSRTEPRQCQQCDSTFSVLRNNSDARYCSRECARKAKIKLPDIFCAACQKPFHPRKGETKFCSRACSHAGNSLRTYPRICAHCDDPFTAANPHAQYCTDSCSQKARYWRKKSAAQVIYLTPQIFDGWFKRAA